MHRLSCLFLLALIGTTAHANKLTLSDVGKGDGDCFVTANATYCGDSSGLPPPGADPRPLDPTKPVSPTNPICGVTASNNGIVCSGGPEGPNSGGLERIRRQFQCGTKPYLDDNNGFCVSRTPAPGVATYTFRNWTYESGDLNAQGVPIGVTCHYTNNTNEVITSQSNGCTYQPCATGWTAGTGADLDKCSRTNSPNVPPGIQKNPQPPVKEPDGTLTPQPPVYKPDNSQPPQGSFTPKTADNPGPTPGVAPLAQDGSSTNPNGVCPAGKTWDAPSHKCLAEGEPAPAPVQGGQAGGQTYTCTAGYKWTGTSCVADTGTGDPVEGEDPCTTNPNRVGCLNAEVQNNNDGLIESTVSIGQLAPTSVTGAGSCPGTIGLNFLGAAIPISYQPACTFAENIKPVVLGVAWVLAGFILVGSSKKED